MKNAAAETGEDRDQRCAKAQGDHRIDHGTIIRRLVQRAREEAEIKRDAKQRETCDKHAGNSTSLECEPKPAGERFVAACATRTLARTETFMPMKPVAPDKRRQWQNRLPPASRA